ncbi:MAG: DUF4845 domain-containing protein [Cellvibrionaceae bacterium]|nr:DUF4845 domain-containing protein [Cellvibrionaceae bacterium]MCV6625333.1 DUF4845 domain-containing protein [Cellvibrionaceae bacterium]
MTRMHKQLGITVSGALVLLFIFGCLLLFASKTVPAYMDDRFVEAALRKLPTGENSIIGRSSEHVRTQLTRTFTLNNVRGQAADPKSWEIQRVDDHFIVIIDYEVRNNLFSNTDVVMHFRHKLDTRNPEDCCRDRAY